MKRSSKILFLSLAVAAVLSISCFAVDSSGNAMISAMQTSLADFSVTSLVPIITAGLGIAVPLVIGWFAFRWIYRKAKGALKSGK